MTLPHQFSKRSVSRYVLILQQLIRDKPTKLTINPSDLMLSPETVTCRLRDAAHAFLSGTQTSPDVNTEQLRVVWPTYKVKHDGALVYVVSRAKQESEKQLDAVSESERNVLATVEPNIDVLSAFALLLGLRVLSGQVRIKGQLSVQTTKLLSEAHDVAFVKEGSYTIML